MCGKKKKKRRKKGKKVFEKFKILETFQVIATCPIFCCNDYVYSTKLVIGCALAYGNS